MGSRGDIDIQHPKYPVHLNKAWHAQATYLIPADFYSDWLRTCPKEIEASGYDPFMPAPYRPALVDGNVQMTFFYVNHIQSDLGAYHHAGVILRVVPDTIPGAYPGFYIGLEVVDEPFTWIAGYRIWGYAKVLGCVDAKNAIPGKDQPLDVTVTLPKHQPNRDKENENYHFDRKNCTERVFTLHIPKPDGTVLPYGRDVYSHTMFEPGNQPPRGPCETRFRRHSHEEGVQPRAMGVRVEIHTSSAYGSWFSKLNIAQLPHPDVRWAPHMSGEWHPARRL